MKQKYIATIGALALTLPALAAAQTPATEQDRDSRYDQQTQQEQQTQQDRAYGTRQPGEGPATQQPGEQRSPTAEGRPHTAPGQERAQEHAQQPGERAAQHDYDRKAGMAGTKFKLDNLTGESIVDQQGEEIGTVEDFLISQDGRIASVLVTTGGVMGIGGETKAVDWDRLEVQKDEDGSIRNLRTTMTQDELENLPEYDEDNDGLFD